MRNSKFIAFILTLAVILSFGFIKYGSTAIIPTSTIPKEHVHVIKNEPEQEEWRVVFDSLQLEPKGLSQEAFKYAWFGYQRLKLQNPVMAIADFSQSSRKKRLYVIDFAQKKLLLNTYVAHGRNSGDEFAKKFSNQNSSYQSSLGFYRTRGTYQGKHGLSLKLDGVEKGINDRAMERAIVMHGADYVSERFIANTGRLGRSLGCPAISMADHKKLIQLLHQDAGLFIFSNNPKYMHDSKIISEINAATANKSEYQIDLQNNQG
jgi:hypothetical protein